MAHNLTAGFLDLRHNEVQRKSHFSIAIDGFTQEFSSHVRSSSLPSKSFDVIATRFFNEVNKQAGARTFSDLPISIHDAVGLDVERQLYDWQEQVQNTRSGVMGYAADYKRTAILTEYNVNGEPRSQWKFEGVWPSDVKFGDMDRDSVDKKEVSVTLQYDKAYLL